MGMRTSAAEQVLLFSFTLDTHVEGSDQESGIKAWFIIYSLQKPLILHVMKDVVGKEDYDFITYYA